MDNIDPTSGEMSFYDSPEQVSDENGEVYLQESGLSLNDSDEDLPKPYLPLRPGEPIPVPEKPVERIPGRILPLKMRPVSGRYRSTGGIFQLELRVDIDRTRPMNYISGDFFRTSGATTLYVGSFIVKSPHIIVTTTAVTIEGVGNYSINTAAPKVKVTIPRRKIIQPQAPATVQFFTVIGRPGAVLACNFQSAYFRSVQFEQDWVSDITLPVFTSYNTGSLPSGGSSRTLSVPSAYAEAGIEMQTAGVWNSVPISLANSNSKWSNPELHAAMETHFSLWKDIPHWKVWLLAAQLHEIGPSLYGIMFDQQGKQRQGCAVFHQGIGGTTSDKLRLQLYTYVHELGHCFNLLHAWQKSYAVPPVPNRPSSLSWMNYPWNYPGGADAFWSNFPFQFDDQEVIHLRHAFRSNIIMGGNNFTVGSALDDPQAFSDPVIDNSGLQLELEARSTFSYGEPVVVEIKLRTSDLRGKIVNSHLHPNFGFVHIGIKKPGGQAVLYEPLIEHCIAEDMITLDNENPSIYESSYIGYGKGGFYFDQVGVYQLRAIYYAPDGSLVHSNILSLRVSAPFSIPDNEVADLFFGNDQGTLLYLLGSDSVSLSDGNDAFELVIDKYSKHPLAVYAQLVKGINAGREFKSMTSGNKISVRKPRFEESIKLLSSVVDITEKGKVIDNITANMTMRKMAHAQKMEGDDKSAKATMARMVSHFRKMTLKPHVIKLIEMQAKSI
jgi:hypothetical protein